MRNIKNHVIIIPKPQSSLDKNYHLHKQENKAQREEKNTTFMTLENSTQPQV